MGANQDMPQAGFAPASSHEEIQLPLSGTIEFSRWLCAKVAGFVPVRDGRRSFQVVFVRRIYCGQEEGSEEEGREESREEGSQEGREESEEVGCCGWRFPAVGFLPGQGRRAALKTCAA